MKQFVAQPFFSPSSEALRYLPECPRMLHNCGDSPMVGWVGIQHGSDSKTGSLNILNLQTRENTSHALPGRPGFYAESVDPGVLLVGVERRLIFYDINRREVTETGVDIPAPERVIINDGTPVPNGVVFGSKDVNFKDEIAAIYFYNTQLGYLCVLREKQICSNGKVLLSHGETSTLVDIDSPRKNLVAYDANLEGCALHDPRILADFQKYDGVPDGMKLTPDGKSVVVAFYNPNAAEFGVVRQVNLETGAVEAEWRLPGSPRVTCPEFVSLDGRVMLLLTTAIEGMPDEIRKQAPHAGDLYVGETDFTRLPPSPPLVSRF